MGWRHPRGICPECGQERPLRWCPGDDPGRGMRRHDHEGAICPGTGCTPDRVTVEYHEVWA